MAPPMIMMGGMMAMQVAGGLMKAAGDTASANAGSAASLQTAQINQQFLQMQADKLTKLGDVAYGRTIRQGLIYKGKSVAMMADAGIDPGQGTPLDILSQQASETEYAAEVKRFDYQEQAWKLSTQGGIDIQTGNIQSAMYQQRGQAAAIGDIAGGLIGAAGTLAGQINFGGGGSPPPGQQFGPPAPAPP